MRQASRVEGTGRTAPVAAAGRPRRRRWPRPGVVAAAIALLTAVVVWIGMALLIVRGEITSALPGGVSGFVVLTAASCIVDFGAAWLVVRDRARGPMLGYLAARTVLAASGVVFLALPSYAVGAAALFASPRPATGPARRHAFEPPDPTDPPPITLGARLFASDWSRLSLPAEAGPRCAACGQPEGSLVHRADDAG